MHVDPKVRQRLSAAACALFVATAQAPCVEAADQQAVQQIESYCAASWRNARIDRQDWEDCTNEAFAELLGRVSRRGLAPAIDNAQSPERRELNRSVWCTIQRWRRAPRPTALADAGQLPERPGQPAHVQHAMAEVREAMAHPESGLSRQQRAILEHWLAGHSVADIAARLDIPSARVSDAKYKAVQKLKASLAG